MNRMLLSGTALLAIFFSSSSGAQAELSSAIEQCRTEQNVLKRLACYDEISIANSDVLTASTERTYQTKNTSPTQADKHTAASEFGLEHKQRNDELPDQIYAVVRNVRYSPRKELIIEFDNGQVWRQNGSGTYLINIGERHFVKRGVFGAFYLGNDNSNRTLKVKRED